MNRQNYGFIYNELIFDISTNIVTKRSKHPDGITKLRKEINFYNSVSKLNIPLPFYIPSLCISPLTSTTLCASTPELCIEYFPHHEPLTERFPYRDPSAGRDTIREIIDHITPLHKYSPRVKLSLNEYKLAIRTEIMDKIIERYYSTDWIRIHSDFERIAYVNNRRVKSLIDYVHAIQKRIFYLIDIQFYRESFGRLSELAPPVSRLNDIGVLTYIHGDIHLGNIMVPRTDCIDKDTHKYVFIDPRGYFASYDLYGEPRYDYAKLLFGVSGYSLFDQMEIHSLDISPFYNELFKEQNVSSSLNINIPFIDDYCDIYEKIREPEWTNVLPEMDEITILLSLSIWLGNNSTFVAPEKKLTSLMISRYLCERYMRI